MVPPRPGMLVPATPSQQARVGAVEWDAPPTDSDEMADVVVHLTWPATQPETRQRPELSSLPAVPARQVERHPDQAPAARVELAKPEELRVEKPSPPLAPSPQTGTEGSSVEPLGALSTRVEELGVATARAEGLALAASSFGPDLNRRLSEYTAYVRDLRTISENLESCQLRQGQMLGQLRDSLFALSDRLTAAMTAGLSEITDTLAQALIGQVDELLTRRLDSITSRLEMESSKAQRRITDELSAQATALGDLRSNMSSTVTRAMAATMARLGAELATTLRAALADELAREVRRELEQMRRLVKGDVLKGIEGDVASGSKAQPSPPAVPLREALALLTAQGSRASDRGPR
jgi:hypothetical protein